MSVRPLQDWVLIELEPAETMAGSLHIPDAEKEPLRTARIVDVGRGRRHPKTDVVLRTCVEPGERIAFFMAALQTKQGAALVHTLEGNQGLIREGDIMFIIDDNNIRVSA